MGSLGDRQFETYRRVAPGRTGRDRVNGAVHKEEFATAVVDAFGNPIGQANGSMLAELLVEQRRTNRLLEILLDEEVGLDDAT